MSKKVLSVVMAVIMLLSCCAVAASAYTYAPDRTSGEVVIVATADKTTVNPGDVVTITMSIDRGSIGELGAFGNTIVYNGDQLTPVGTTPQTFRTWEGDCAASFANPNASGNMNYAVATQLANQMTAEELAYFTKGIMILGSSTSSALRWNPTGLEAYMSFQMTVSDSVQPGDEIWVGTHDACVEKGVTYFAEGTKRLPQATAYNLTNSMVKLTVAGGEVSAPVLTKGRAQYKMETLVPGVSVADNFQYRVLSTISKADWEAHFENTAVEGATTKALTEVGFIAADTATFDLNTAKTAVIANTTGDYTTGLPAGYKAATTNHIYRTDGDATFACRVDTSKDTCADLTYIAFAKYLDADGQPQVIFYDEAATVLLKSSYVDLVNRWLGR